jgi:hypothetical protein
MFFSNVLHKVKDAKESVEIELEARRLKAFKKSEEQKNYSIAVNRKAEERAFGRELTPSERAAYAQYKEDRKEMFRERRAKAKKILQRLGDESRKFSERQKERQDDFAENNPFGLNWARENKE